MTRSIENDSQLVIRRGQSFKLKINCNRPFSRTKDKISLILTVADDEKPSYGHGTLVGTALKNNSFDLGDPLEWGAAVYEVHGDILEIVVKPAAQAPVTSWKLDIDTKLDDGPSSKSFSLKKPFYVLFNPWCVDDQVFMADQSNLDEYIAADTSLIWRGSYNRLRPSVWKFGQFEKDVLDASLYVISKIGKINPAYRGDPVKVSRALSAAVNSVDDEGVVMGNWSDDFSDGIAPTKWVGSTDILQKFYRKKKPVKYGQCWIFAGVLTSICRAVGIPSRIVTTYSSAHDTQSSLTVDYFVDANGQVMEEMNSDSIWNYHVWNEVWMERPDLGFNSNGSYGGWQAVDATPQEQSDSMYRCGPASVLAVKLGEVLMSHDCNFVYSEVNADKVFWKYSGPAAPLKLIRKDIHGIGLFISTKAVGKWEREDITSSYKFAEKSTEERSTMLKALQQARHQFARYYLNEDFNEIYFNFELRDDIKIGETFAVVLHVKNRSDENTHKVSGTLNVDTVMYTGRNRDPVKSTSFDLELKPLSKDVVTMEVVFDEYYSKLMDQSAFTISCMANVKEIDYEYFAQDDFRVRKPDIKITLQGDTISQQSVDCILRLTNPLPIPLKKGYFRVEGPGIESARVFKIAEIPIGGTAASTFKLIPPYAGRAAIVAKFQCKELDDVDGFLAFEVQPRPEDVLMNGNTSNEIISRTDVIP